MRHYVLMMWTNNSIFSVTLMNIMQNFIPNETIICDDRDPPCIKKEIKQLNRKTNFTNDSFEVINLYINQFKALQDKLAFLIKKLRNSYY